MMTVRRAARGYGYPECVRGSGSGARSAVTRSQLRLVGAAPLSVRPTDGHAGRRIQMESTLKT